MAPGAAHLTKRFFGSLVPFGPSPADDAWARASLTPNEGLLWQQMARADRRHAVGVARRVEASLGADATRPVMAAALLHDCGKTVAGLGTFARVLVTVTAKLRGRERVAAWVVRPGWRHRAAQYVTHPGLGADLLHRAGSDPLTVAWAAEHQRGARSGVVPARIADALTAADDD